MTSTQVWADAKRQPEILVWTDEDRIGENPFVISKDIVNIFKEKTDWDTQKNIRTLEQSWNLLNQSPVKPHLF